MTEAEIKVMMSALGQKFDPEVWAKRRRLKERIPIILDTIRDLWSAHPEQRLCQLIMNALNFHGDPYAVEDDELLRKLQNVLEPK